VSATVTATVTVKQFKRGLVVGKFCPLHRGHMLVIDAALAACDEVVVVSYTKPEFEGCGPQVRRQWLQALYPQVRSLVLEDGAGITLPANDAPDAQQREFVGWVCLALLGFTVDAVFTSEDYGDGLAAALGVYFAQRGAQCAPVRHVCVDKARALVPISGTAIRADPVAARQFLAPPVYASFVKRIAVLGGESSGKTSLAQALAGRLGTVWAPEYGRERWVEKAGALAFDDLLHIAQVQAAREDALAQMAGRWLLCDTTPLTTLCYSMASFGRADPQLVALAERAYDTILLCAPDFPFVQDGTRRDTHFRSEQHEWYRNELDRKQIAYTVLAGPLEQRVQRALTLLIKQTQIEP
jgi:HTH-type transcriptional repressor of NAD biosynthesis genes